MRFEAWGEGIRWPRKIALMDLLEMFGELVIESIWEGVMDLLRGVFSSKSEARDTLVL